MKKMGNKTYFFAKVLTAVVIILSVMSIFNNITRWTTQNEQIKKYHEEKENIRIENEELQNLLDSPINDEYIAQVVKDKLDYRKSDGILFHNDLYD